MEESNKIEEQLTPQKIKGKIFYRCPYTDCRKKFDRKQPTMDHVRSIHLQLKSFCENCKRNVSFVSFDRHVRSCIGRNIVAGAARPLIVPNPVTRSTTSTRNRLMHTANVHKSIGQRFSMHTTNVQKSIGKRSVDYTHIPKVEQTTSQQLEQIQTPNSVINEIALLWSYERSREDELDLFGKYVASEMRVLTKNNQFHLKRRIQQLLLEYDPTEQVSRLAANTNSEINFAETILSSTCLSSEQGYSNALAPDASQHSESSDTGYQSFVIPKNELVEDYVSTPMKCLFCNRNDNEIFHGNVNEINTSHSHTRILDIIEGWLGSCQPTENSVCCDTCLRQINSYDLERMNMEKMLQSDLMNFDP